MTWRPLPADSPSGEPRRLTSSLDRMARSLGSPGLAPVAVVFARWAELVGPDLSRGSRPLWLGAGTLVVAVDDGATASALRWKSTEILRRVRDLAGDGVAERVEVRVRPPR